MDAATLERFEVALTADDLNRLAETMTRDGLSQAMVYDRFEQFRDLLRQTGREADEDVVMNAMDCIVGWCGPHARLFPRYLADSEIRSYRQRRDAVAPKKDLPL